MRRLYLALFAIGLAVYGVAAGSRLARQSGAPHFVYQADAWLSGTLAVAPNCGPCGPDDDCTAQRACRRGEMPLPADDWATVETVELADGTIARGRRLLQTPRTFRTLDGTLIGTERIKRSLGYTAYVSFPAFPALIMLPSALIAGRAGNDVIPTVLLAACILPLSLLLLRRITEAGLTQRTLHDDLWLVGMFAFGSVMLFSSIQGKVWFTAHVVGVVLALLYAWASIGARHPVIAGLALGAAALTRTSMAFMFPLFLYELWRIHRSDRRALLRTLGMFAAPVVAFAIIGMLYNYVRFDSPTEFGHSYLALGNRQPVRQQVQIETWGLASLHYLPRNLAVIFALLPDVSTSFPFLKISGHGLALWLTTPVLLLLVWPRTRGRFHLVLWITTLFVALPSLLYMNTGWVQFGYRFSLDYMVFLMLLLAIGGRANGWLARGLIIAGVVINLFGAYTFDRDWRFYNLEYKTYESVL